MNKDARAFAVTFRLLTAVYYTSLHALIHMTAAYQLPPLLTLANTQVIKGINLAAKFAVKLGKKIKQTVVGPRLVDVLNVKGRVVGGGSHLEGAGQRT